MLYRSCEYKSFNNDQEQLYYNKLYLGSKILSTVGTISYFCLPFLFYCGYFYYATHALDFGK